MSSTIMIDWTISEHNWLEAVSSNISINVSFKVAIEELQRNTNRRQEKIGKIVVMAMLFVKYQISTGMPP